MVSRAFFCDGLSVLIPWQMKEFTTVRADSDRGDFSGLSRIHPVLCGLKVLVSTATVKDLETARRTLGGHGYSAFAGIGRLYADYLPAVTYVCSTLIWMIIL